MQSGRFDDSCLALTTHGTPRLRSLPAQEEYVLIHTLDHLVEIFSFGVMLLYTIPSYVHSHHSSMPEFTEGHQRRRHHFCGGDRPMTTHGLFALQSAHCDIRPTVRPSELPNHLQIHIYSRIHKFTKSSKSVVPLVHDVCLAWWIDQSRDRGASAESGSDASRCLMRSNSKSNLIARSRLPFTDRRDIMKA